MRPILVSPADDDERGPVVLRAPLSKSLALRGLIAAVGAGGGDLVMPPPWPQDVVDLIRALELLGTGFEISAGRCRVTRGPDRDLRTPIRVSIGEGAAPARFLLALAATLERPVSILAAGRLPERPMIGLVEALRHLGARIEGGPGFPLTVRGPIAGGREVVLFGAPTSQFLSALLLVAPSLEGALRIRVDGPMVSGPYVELTRRVMSQWGVFVGPGLEFDRGATYRPAIQEVESDWSGATVLLAAAPFLRRAVRVPGLSFDSAQPDRRFVGVLERLGVSVVESDAGVMAWGSVQRGGRFACGDFPDSVPALAALGALAPKTLFIREAAHLRVKESDRIDGLCALLVRFGIEARDVADGLKIGPGRTSVSSDPVIASARGDHRLAMAAALLGLSRPVLIDDGECVAKSFPGFFEQWPGTVAWQEIR